MADNKNKQEKLKKKIIFYIALLSVYFILTAMAAFIFEYYTVTTTEGEIIFSLSMSWQVILFAVELITIVLQGVMLILILRNISQKKYTVLKTAGIIAGLIAFAAVIYLIISDGFKLYPTLLFAIYTAVIVIVRTFLIPHTVSGLLKSEKKQLKP